MSAPQHSTTKDVFGPGTFVDTEFHSVPDESRRLLRLLASKTPGFTQDEAALSDVKFSGDDLSIIPGPLKSQALAASLHGMIGIVGKEILALKNIDTGDINIDTDKAGLYPATAALAEVDGKSSAVVAKDGTLTKAGVDLDKGVLSKKDLYFRTWAIYPTSDKHVWYQIMGNLDPEGFLKAYGIDPETPTKSRSDAYDVIKAEISKYSAGDLELKNMEHGFTGQTCYTPKHWRETTMGKAMARHPVVDYKQVPGTSSLPPVPFPKIINDKRPLAGIKILELGRVIALPAAGALLAALGADVIAVQSPNLTNLGTLALTLTAGKRTYSLDLTKASDRKHLSSLIQDADVIMQAFRLGSLERKGFGLEDIIEMSKKRNKGAVYLDLNCYGPDGYYAERPGFQQIADAATGCSYVCGKSLGFKEGTGVLPSLPIADMLSGAVAVLDVMLALRDRAKHGGSYHAFAALVAVDALQLTEEVGLYSPETVGKIQDKYEFGPMTPDLMVEELLYVLAEAWGKKSDILRRQGYMVNFPETPFGKNHAILSPVVKYGNEECSPGWRSGPVPYCYSESEGWADVLM